VKRRRPPKPKTNLRYGRHHKALRKRLEPKVAAGMVRCARCGRPIIPGTPWDLDHSDDRLGYRGASHAAYNRATSRHRRQSRDW
jgi:hypothetical protein